MAGNPRRRREKRRRKVCTLVYELSGPSDIFREEEEGEGFTKKGGRKSHIKRRVFPS